MQPRAHLNFQMPSFTLYQPGREDSDQHRRGRTKTFPVVTSLYTKDENSTTQIMLALTHLPVFCLLIFPQLEVIPGLYHFPGRSARLWFRRQPPLAQRARWINDLE